MAAIGADAVFIEEDQSAYAKGFTTVDLEIHKLHCRDTKKKSFQALDLDNAIIENYLQMAANGVEVRIMPCVQKREQ